MTLSSQTAASTGKPLIVAAAILDTAGASFFAARRTYPPTLSGLWEFPGGKVEEGEEPHTALLRECREELGVEVCLGDEVTGEDGAVGWPLANGLRMRVFTARLAPGVSPDALRLSSAHDDGAWLPLAGAETAVPWIPADLPIVASLARTALPADDTR